MRFKSKKTSVTGGKRAASVPGFFEVFLNQNYGFVLGCSPIASKARRELTRPGRFSCNKSAVARPSGDKPRIERKSSLQPKCSDHFWVRGLKRGVFSPLSVSIHWMCVHFRVLQASQARARFAKSLLPPEAKEMIWSTWKMPGAYSNGCLQYSQQPPARS